MTDDKLNADFEKHYGKSSPEPNLEARLKNPDYRFIWCLNQITGKIVLDVGCADGQFLKMMKATGLEPEGYDASSRARFSAQKNANVPIYSALDIIRAASFDTVVSLQTIEHVDKPDEFLKDIGSKAKDMIIFTTPIENALPDPMHKHGFTVYSINSLVTQVFGEDADFNIYYLNKFREGLAPNLFGVVIRLKKEGENNDS